MKLVIVESPFSAGDTAAIMAHIQARGLKGDDAAHSRVRDGIVSRNIAYGRAAVADCIARGEAPLASHLLYTQPGILDDRDDEERKLGIESGLAWYAVAEACIVYDDYGISLGMESGIARAKRVGIPVIGRKIFPHDMTSDRLRDLHEPFGGSAQVADAGAKTLDEVLSLGAASEARLIADDLILEGVRRELRGDRRAGLALVQAGEALRDRD